MQETILNSWLIDYAPGSTNWSQEPEQIRLREDRAYTTLPGCFCLVAVIWQISYLSVFFKLGRFENHCVARLGEVPQKDVFSTHYKTSYKSRNFVI